MYRYRSLFAVVTNVLFTFAYSIWYMVYAALYNGVLHIIVLLYADTSMYKVTNLPTVYKYTQIIIKNSIYDLLMPNFKILWG